MSRRRLYHEDECAYLEVMRKAFENHYVTGTDVWSQDASLTEAARRSLQAWRGRNIEQRPNMLDIGCGNARVFRILGADISNYTGVDLCKHPKWREIQDQMNSSADFVVGDFIKWSLEQEGGSYDLVLDHGCLHHQHPNVQGTWFKAIVKLLAPGGVLSLVVWAERWKQGDIGEDGRFHLPFSLEQIEHMIAETELELVVVTETRARVNTKQYHAVMCKPKDQVNEVNYDV